MNKYSVTIVLASGRTSSTLVFADNLIAATEIAAKLFGQIVGKPKLIGAA